LFKENALQYTLLDGSSAIAILDTITYRTFYMIYQLNSRCIGISGNSRFDFEYLLVLWAVFGWSRETKITDFGLIFSPPLKQISSIED